MLHRSIGSLSRTVLRYHFLACQHCSQLRCLVLKNAWNNLLTFLVCGHQWDVVLTTIPTVPGLTSPVLLLKKQSLVYFCPIYGMKAKDH